MTFETVLGPAHGRYFGSGYRRVTHRLISEPRQNYESHSIIAEVVYPDSWSLDAESKAKTPHLSSIDAVVLALLALKASRLVDESLISRIDLTAGAQPWSRLEAVPIHIEAQMTSAISDEAEVFLALVGNIRVQFEINTSPAAPQPRAPKEMSISRRNIFPSQGAADHIEYMNQSAPLKGFHSRRHSTAVTGQGEEDLIARSFVSSVTDYLATIGQMAQAMMALKHNIGREGNLWMRKVTIAFGQINACLPDEYTSTLSIVRDRLVGRSERLIRDFSVSATISNGVRIEALLAHEDVPQ